MPLRTLKRMGHRGLTLWLQAMGTFGEWLAA
jgi:hypothetical protein